MITNEAQLQQVVEQIGRMYDALTALQAEVLPQSRQQFALMAEVPVEELRRLQQEIMDYIHRTLDAPDDSRLASVPVTNAA